MSLEGKTHEQLELRFQPLATEACDVMTFPCFSDVRRLFLIGASTSRALLEHFASTSESPSAFFFEIEIRDDQNATANVERYWAR